MGEFNKKNTINSKEHLKFREEFYEEVVNNILKEKVKNIFGNFIVSDVRFLKLKTQFYESEVSFFEDEISLDDKLDVVITFINGNKVRISSSEWCTICKEQA